MYSNHHILVFFKQIWQINDYFSLILNIKSEHFDNSIDILNIKWRNRSKLWNRKINIWMIDINRRREKILSIVRLRFYNECERERVSLIIARKSKHWFWFSKCSIWIHYRNYASLKLRIFQIYLK